MRYCQSKKKNDEIGAHATFSKHEIHVVHSGSPSRFQKVTDDIQGEALHKQKGENGVHATHASPVGYIAHNGYS
jgi:hypothetical protein